MLRFKYQGCKAYKKCKGPIRADISLEAVNSVDVLIIGEAPSEKGEGWGMPFEGRVERILRSTLEEISDNYILTNCRCCYGIKAPVPTEIKPCKKNWKKLVARYRPKVVVALGKIAAKAVLGRKIKMVEDIGHVSILNVLGHEAIFVVNFNPL